MSIGHKSGQTQAFRLMLYSRALHPELIEVRARRMFRHGDYEVETWIMQTGHVVRFQFEDLCLTETVIEQGDHLPETGLMHALPCIGEKDYEMEPDEGLGYMTTIQTESLIENLYMATLREMRDFANESKAVLHEWQDNDGERCLSMVDVQKYKREFHVQSYHLVGGPRLVLRTQSIFKVV